jgi:hypothetical protein
MTLHLDGEKDSPLPFDLVLRVASEDWGSIRAAWCSGYACWRRSYATRTAGWRRSTPAWCPRERSRIPPACIRPGSACRPTRYHARFPASTWSLTGQAAQGQPARAGRDWLLHGQPLARGMSAARAGARRARLAVARAGFAEGGADRYAAGGGAGHPGHGDPAFFEHRILRRVGPALRPARRAGRWRR